MTARLKRTDDPTSVLKLELGTVLGRYAKRPPFDGQPLLAPFNEADTETWVPPVWVKQKGGDKFKLQAPSTPWRACTRVLTLLQDRLREAGNKAIIAAWINRHLPKPPKGTKAKDVVPGQQLFPGTVIYRELTAQVVGGDPKQGAFVPRVSADVVAATSRRIDQLCSRLWKPKLPKMVALDERWPLFFRPTGWCFVDPDCRTIAFNADGTWWHVELRIPRPKKGSNTKRAAQKAAYVNATLERLAVGEADRGKPTAQAPVAPDKWIASTLALFPDERKWIAALSYRYPARAPYPVENALVVHCGLRTFAAYQDVATLVGHGRGRVEYVDGSQLLHRKFQFRRQRQRLMRSARKFASHGRGHKHQARAFRVRQTERAFVDDWLRRRAHRIVNIARERKAKLFVAALTDVRKRAEAGDLPKGVKVAVHQAPWYRFRMFIEQAASKVGVPVETYAPVYHTQRCPNPMCGHTDKAACHYGKKWLHVCVKCGRTQGLEGVAITNAIWDLAREGRIELPDRAKYQDYFDKIEDQLAAQEQERQAQREASHLTSLGDERFGAVPNDNKQKQEVKAKPTKRKKNRSKKATQTRKSA